MTLSTTLRRARRSSIFALALTLGACAGGGSSPASAPAEVAPDLWAGLAAPRPTPLPGAPRIALAGVEVAATGGELATGTAGDAVTELVRAGLLERTDLEFVERKRFAPAADRERRGLEPLAGQPPVGTSRSPEWRLRASIVLMPGMTGRIDLQLSDPTSGQVARAWQLEVPNDIDAVGAARTVVSALALHLAEEGLAPAEAPSPAAVTPVASGIPGSAVESFLAGVRAGDRWDWDAARVAYQRAIREGGGQFEEAGIALRRAARLRAGGSLGAS